MRLAFCFYKYFAHSGLARDMLRIAYESTKRGHELHLYCREWRGPRPNGIPVTVLPVRGLSNHGRALGFVKRLSQRLSGESYDAIVGFNKMPGLDFYFAADGCYTARARRRYNRLYELTPRYRTWHRLEAAVFGPESNTRIFLLSEQSRLDYRASYATADERMYMLPPTLDAVHQLDNLTADRREDVRSSLGIGSGETLMLMVGSGFYTKGVDRTLQALAALPDSIRQSTRLVVIGHGETHHYQWQAKRLGLENRVLFTGGREDVPEVLRAADILIHPARHETAGTALLEGLAAGLPVVTTANCGYAHHVREANAGIVLNMPFRQKAFNDVLLELLSPASAKRRRKMEVNAKRYGQNSELYRMPETVVDLMESWKTDPAPARNFTGYVHPELSDLSDQLPELDDWLQLEGDVHRRTADRRTLRFEHKGKGYFLKAHFGVGWGEILKNLVQFKWPVMDAGNEWLAIHALKLLGIPTLDAVAYGRSSGSIGRRSFIVTRELVGMTSLERDIEHSKHRDPIEYKRRRKLVQKVAIMAQVLHGNGINHRDFYLCHFLFDPATRMEDPDLYLIDLHRAQVRHRTRRRWRIKDIAGLYYSALGASLTRHERLRFIQAYAGTATLRLALEDSAFWEQVERKALALRRAELKRGYADASGVAKQVN